MARRGDQTRERILDAAEKLFAERGFHGVTVRQITGLAGVDTALANYHFGPKRALFDAVLMRRAEELNEARLAILEEIERDAGDGPPDLERIIDAFTHPLLDRSERGGPGWKSYFALIAQVNNSPEWGGKLMTEYFDPLVRRFIAAIKRALPDADEKDIYWSYHFLSGALVLTFAETGRIDNLSDGAVLSHDLESVHKRLPPFIAAGFHALVERGKAKRDAGRTAAE
jgi:AcrR family transcriptional regulator